MTESPKIQSYFYRLSWHANAHPSLDHDLHYAGARHKARCCHPKELLAPGGYFTSSGVVHYHLMALGKPDKVEIKPFADKESLLLYEHMFLLEHQAASNSFWINKHNGGETFCTPTYDDVLSRFAGSAKQSRRSK
jgi:hypothetical protein